MLGLGDMLPKTDGGGGGVVISLKADMFTNA